ncbi:MAG: 1-(5-phosphoribosyl)-5-[(5-phosphoribosylamino)methylideneamino]imidazole-4-carboxamide isomerase [Clostridia bacterium]|nr:1-(5-phosphoribosyl)-5-[(5-phosphoribosylamino)methylideneamino]imidazole-4-carboxamide isomerase [Clostridia bacterium]
MVILPAIDIFEGKAVRLYKGDYNEKTVYGENPVEFAVDFGRVGARQIHIVDLEGAKTGGTPNFDIIKQIIKESKLLCEVGGGIRDMSVIEKYLSADAGRVILGTAAAQDADFVRIAVKEYGDKIAVGADLKGGHIAIKGWMEKSDLTAEDFFDNMCRAGVKTAICTDISKDGAMAGTNLNLYKTLLGKYDMNIIASGGVSSLEDIKALNGIGVYGAIIGKAYYSGALDLKSALEVAGC